MAMEYLYKHKNKHPITHLPSIDVPARDARTNHPPCLHHLRKTSSEPELTSAVLQPPSIMNPSGSGSLHGWMGLVFSRPRMWMWSTVWRWAWDGQMIQPSHQPKGGVINSRLSVLLHPSKRSFLPPWPWPWLAWGWGTKRLVSDVTSGFLVFLWCRPGLVFGSWGGVDSSFPIGTVLS